jgi:hypothetical protein
MAERSFFPCSLCFAFFCCRCSCWVNDTAKKQRELVGCYATSSESFNYLSIHRQLALFTLREKFHETFKFKIDSRREHRPSQSANAFGRLHLEAFALITTEMRGDFNWFWRAKDVCVQYLMCCTPCCLLAKSMTADWGWRAWEPTHFDCPRVESAYIDFGKVFNNKFSVALIQARLDSSHLHPSRPTSALHPRLTIVQTHQKRSRTNWERKQNTFDGQPISFIMAITNPQLCV